MKNKEKGAIEQFTKYGRKIMVYDTLAEAAEKLKTNPHFIYKVLLGITKSHKESVFKYISKMDG